MSTFPQTKNKGVGMKKIFYLLLVLSSVSSAHTKSTGPNVDNYVGNSDQEFKYRRHWTCDSSKIIFIEDNIKKVITMTLNLLNESSGSGAEAIEGKLYVSTILDHQSHIENFNFSAKLKNEVITEDGLFGTSVKQIYLLENSDFINESFELNITKYLFRADHKNCHESKKGCKAGSTEVEAKLSFKSIFNKLGPIEFKCE